MKKILFFLFIFNNGFSQSTIITPGSGQFNTNSNPISTITLPKMSYEQIKSIPSPTLGMLLCDITFNCVRFFDGSKWISLGAITNPEEDINDVICVGSGNNFYAIDATTGLQKWVFAGTGFYNRSPIIYNGAVYVTSDTGVLYAIDVFTGVTKWSITIPNGFKLYSPTINNGVIYIVSDCCNNDGNVYAFDATTGIKKWSSTIESSDDAMPMVFNGVVYIQSNNGHVYALDASTGVKIWMVNYNIIGYVPYFSPTFSPIYNQTLFVQGLVGLNYYLDALDSSTGLKKWSFNINNGMIFYPAIFDGTIFFSVLSDSYFHAIDALTGTSKWNFHTNSFSSFNSNPTVSNGIVYVGSVDANLYALDALNGTKKWSFGVGGSNVGNSTVANGTVFVASGNKNIYALNATTGAIKWTFLTSSPTNSPVCVLTKQGKVYRGLGNIHP